MASSQAAAACGETDQLKCRTPIINNYFSMTVLKFGLSFTCISLSPESLNKKNTSSPIVEHLKYIDPVLKCWCGLALNGQVMWPGHAYGRACYVPVFVFFVFYGREAYY